LKIILHNNFSNQKVDKIEKEEPIGRLGAFQGQKQRYNKKIIMKLLYRKMMTTNEIAALISQEERSHYRSVHSVISSDTGGLNKLKEKHYIAYSNNKKWELTPKGFMVSLTQVSNIGAIIPFYREDYLHLFEHEGYPETFPFTRHLKKRELKKFREFLISKEYFEFLRNQVKDLINKGDDLDGWDKEHLFAYLSSKKVQAFLEHKASLGKFSDIGLRKPKKIIKVRRKKEMKARQNRKAAKRNRRRPKRGPRR